MTTAINIGATFTTEAELDRAIAVEAAARKFLEIKRLVEEYKKLEEIARAELLVAAGDVSEYITGAEFGDLRVTITPVTTPEYDKKQLLALALEADPKKETYFKLDESKAKKAPFGKRALSGAKQTYRVEVKANV